MSKELILYDLARKGSNACWSANVWKTRMVLNYKKIPYRTEWIHHGNMAEILQPLVTPNETGTPYTVPTIQFPDRSAVMESTAIAQKLEQLHPSPPLHLDPALQGQLGGIMMKIGPALIPIFMPRIAREVIVDDSAAKFHESRQKRFGMSVYEMEQEKGGEPAWQTTEPIVHELSAFIKQHKKDEGPFVLGSQVSYVDFIIASLLEGMRRIGQDIYDRLVSYDNNVKQLHEACQQWMQKAD